jgi:hypothetical protein
MRMPMSRDGARDAFWPQPWNDTAFDAACAAAWPGYDAREPGWAAQTYGGTNLRGASNILFTNGDRDPWAYAGVKPLQSTSLPASIEVLTVVGGAHHLDLMFQHPLDPQSVIDVRNAERAAIRRWIAQAAAASPPTACDSPAKAGDGGVASAAYAALGAAGGAVLTVAGSWLWSRQGARAVGKKAEMAMDEALLDGLDEEEAEAEAALLGGEGGRDAA